MKDSLRLQLQRLAFRLTELDANLADPQVMADMKRFRTLAPCLCFFQMKTHSPV